MAIKAKKRTIKVNDLVVYKAGHYINSPSLIGMIGKVLSRDNTALYYGYPAVQVRFEEFDYSSKHYSFHTVYADNLNVIGKSAHSWEL